MSRRRAKRSMRMRMTALFAMMAIIPAAVLGTVSLRLFSQTLESNGVQVSQNYLDFIDFRISTRMKTIHENALIFVYDNTVRDYCDPQASSAMSDQAFFEVERYVERRMTNLFTTENAYEVMLILGDGRMLSYTVKDFPSVRHSAVADYQTLPEEEFELFDAWGEPRVVDGVEVVPYERMILSPTSGEETARLVIFYKNIEFAGLFSAYERDRGTEFFVVMDGRIVFCTSGEKFACELADVLQMPTDAFSGSRGDLRASDAQLLSYLHNDRWGYMLVESIPTRIFTLMFGPTLKLMLGLAVLSVIVCFVLGSIVSHGFTKPIYALIRRMNQNRFPAPQEGGPIAGNEIAILNERYDDVFNRLEMAIADYHEEQQKKKEAQIRALEFQINPHFLYNTLSTIVWLIDAGEAERAIEITQKLSEFFRVSISKGRDFISIREEIRHVQLYLDIQKARYEGQIFVRFMMPESLLDLNTPKLILQPLVENSIIHAMQKNHDRTCHIEIFGYEEGDSVVLAVEDDGETATEETIRAMNAFLQDLNSVHEGENYGIGISNVHDRIAMSFGTGYGLCYQRASGHTIAWLRLKRLEGKRDV